MSNEGKFDVNVGQGSFESPTKVVKQPLKKDLVYATKYSNLGNQYCLITPP